MTVYLELNDLELRATNDRGEVLVEESAVAATGNGDLVFGSQAWHHSRTHPQQFNGRYLSSLSAHPLTVPLGPARNLADLVYHHFKALDLPQEPVVLGVSGHLSNEQLGLLLGICNEAGMQVRGFADLALAHVLTALLPDDFHVLDIELHRATLSAFHSDGESLTMTGSTVVDGVGWGNVVESWMAAIADEFVQKTRFDPLHSGTTEQQLFDQVRGWFSAGAEQARRVVVEHADTRREIEVPPRILHEKARQRLAGLDLSGVTALAVTHRVDRMPGLLSALQSKLPGVVVLNEGEVLTGYQTLAGQLPRDSIGRMTRARIDRRAASATVQLAPAATHLLTDWVARPFSAFDTQIKPDGTTRDGDVSVNGDSGPGQTVRAGDEVGIGHRVYTAIRVE